MNRTVGSLVLLTLIAGLASCKAASSAGASPTAGPLVPTTAGLARTPLPPAALSGTVSLEEALARRRSIREYSAAPLTEEEIGQLLWAAQGITHPSGLRTAPSAGALYPLEVYIATEKGVLHYLPGGHQVEVVSQQDKRQALYRAALEQEAVRQGAAVFVIAAVLERTAEKYGDGRSPRYVYLEAGHAAQNLLLQATALELGAVPIGAFEDDQILTALDLPEDHEPLYVIPVGHGQ